MKILVATDKPFAAVAVNGIKDVMLEQLDGVNEVRLIYVDDEE